MPLRWWRSPHARAAQMLYRFPQKRLSWTSHVASTRFQVHYRAQSYFTLFNHFFFGLGRDPSVHLYSAICGSLSDDIWATWPFDSYETVISLSISNAFIMSTFKTLSYYLYTAICRLSPLVVCSTNVSMQWTVKAEAASRHHIPVGIPASAATELWLLPELHQMGWPRAWHLQTDQLKGCLASVGYPQEQARHELWDNGPCFEVSCIVELCFVFVW